MADIAQRRFPRVPAEEWVTRLPPATRYVLQGDAATRAFARPVWGVGFSELACRATSEGGRATLWLGPDEYLLLDSALDTPLFASLEAALYGVPHALVDVSHRQLALEIHGPHATTLLSGACPLDLHPSAFPVGMCSRTVLAKADIVLWRIRDDAFHLEIWRSFAGYVTGVLQEIAIELAPHFL